MKIANYKGYEVHVPTSGGKAGTGYNKTSTIQVRDGYMVLKQVRFTMADQDSRSKAMRKARQYIDEIAKADGAIALEVEESQ